MRWWRDRLVRRTLLAALVAVAAIFWAIRELVIDPDVMLGYLWGSLLFVLGIAVPAVLLVVVIKRFRG